MNAIDVRSIGKTFTKKLTKKVCALNDVSFSVPEGSAFGFIGPNGAGKSTTIKILMGLLRPDSGSTLFYGRNSFEPAARKRVGYLAENPAYYEYLTPRELLEFVACHFDAPSARADRVAEVLEQVGLTDAADRPLRSLSKGMVQRIGLGQTLVHDPDLYILDEPMSGLDPLGRVLVADIIQQLKRRGKTVFFSTHIINDVERICDDVLLLVGGSVRYHGSVKTVVDQSYSTYEVVVRNGAGAAAMEPGFVLSETREGETIRLSVPKQNLEAVIAKVSNHGELLSVEPERRTLEQIFVELIKSSAGSKGGE